MSAKWWLNCLIDMSLTKRVIQEMGMDLGGHPDHIDRTRKQHIERGTHPYAQNPAWPKEPGEGSWPGGDSHLRPGGRIRSFAELAASDQYSTIMKAVTEYLGRAPRTQQEVMQVMMRYQQGVQFAMQIESEHKQELEQLAVKAVLDLPEYKYVKVAVEAGTLIISAKLEQPEAGDFRVEPEEEPEEFQVPEIKTEIDAEMHKRRFLNVMMQGAAINQNYLFKNVERELAEIDTQLPRLYGQIMSGADLAYWVFPEEMQQSAMGSGEGEGAAGKERLEFTDDQKCIVHATAVMWPVLVQEIVKGIMEYAAYDEDADPTVRKQVQGQVDTLSNETWDIRLGPAVWRQFVRQIGDDKEVTALVYRYLSELSPGDFSAHAHAIMQGTPEGKRFMQNLIAKAKEAAGDEGEAGEEGGFEPPQGWSPDAPEGPAEPTAPEPPEKPNKGNEEDDWWMRESQSPIVKKLLS